MSRDDQVEALYRVHGIRLLGYLVRRVQEPEDAADLLSEVLVTAWRRREALPPPPDDVLWLFGVARNLLANERRATRRRDGATRALAAALRTTGTQREAVDVDEVLDVHAALARLPNLDREIVQLTAWEGLTSEEVGQVLGMAAPTVRSRLTRARARMRTELDQATHRGPATERDRAPASAG